MIEPCAPWITEQELPSDCADDAAITPAIAQLAIAMASMILFNRTKRRWPGTCTDTWMPGGRRFHCCANRLNLPAPYVSAITSVTIDGVVLASDQYDLVYPNELVRANGQGWPCRVCCPTYDPDAFTIVYEWGQSPPDVMKTAASIMAKEFAIAMAPGSTGKCRLPAAVTSVVRAGVSIQARVNTYETMMQGDTGLPEVNMMLAAIDQGDATSIAVFIPGNDGGRHLL